MKKWQIENSEASEISEIFFRAFDFALKPKSKSQIQKNSKKNFRDIQDFRVFDLAYL